MARRLPSGHPTPAVFRRFSRTVWRSGPTVHCGRQCWRQLLVLLLRASRSDLLVSLAVSLSSALETVSALPLSSFADRLPCLARHQYSFNVTSAPLTCQSVGAAVSGGVPPYTLTQLVSGDTAHNSTFSTSQVSYQNTLSAGATYMISISDSVGNYADTSSLTYSGGGGATYCLTGSSDGPKSGTGDASPTPKPKGSGNHKSTTAIVGAIIAVAAVIVSALIFWYYRRKHKKQTQELLNARGGFNGYPGGGFGNHNDATLAGGSSGYPGRPGEKFASPMENAGGGWRPESPTEYPGGAGAPVRFRVMNPDDDERSEASVRTTRSAYKTRNGQNQRRSLIEGDHNSLYPPTVSTHRSGTRSRSGTTTYGSEAGDQPWPTFSSNASSTEDHYMDHPASSAGNIAVGSGASRNDGSTGLTSDASFLHSRQPSKWSASSTDLSDVGDEEGYTDDDLQSQASGQTYRSGGHTGLFRAGSSSSNAYGSPFADSQRVQDR